MAYLVVALVAVIFFLLHLLNISKYKEKKLEEQIKAMKRSEDINWWSRSHYQVAYQCAVYDVCGAQNFQRVQNAMRKHSTPEMPK
jgi:hypothetical protein